MHRCRRATAADANAAARIIADALGAYGLPFEPEGRDADVATFGGRPDHDDLVAEREGAVVGVVSVGPHGDPGVAWVSKLFVAASDRGAGIGSALLEAAHGAARRRGFVRVGLRTRLVFAEAIRRYEAAGYVRAPGPTDPDAVVYFREL